METDEWVANALADDSLVVELLLRLKQSTAAPSQLPPRPKLSWGTRQPRSKPARKKERDPMMIFSPTTPLSWSSGATAAASPSDDSCRPSDLSSGSRSKGTCTNDSIACSSANKNLKRKKSLNEPHEEESLLIKERRIQLKNGLEPTYATTEKQKVNIENSKRLKTDLHQELASEIASKSFSPEVLSFHQIKAADGTRIDNMYGDDSAAVNSSKPERGFVLPDLNMTPPEDDDGFC